MKSNFRNNFFYFVINLLSYIPDKIYLHGYYFAYTKHFLNIKNPQSFNEKLQWLKLYERRDEYTQLVDKYEVRKIVAEKIGQEYLIPLLGVWDQVDDIDFNALPQQFVLKGTHDSGSVVVCRDKDNWNLEENVEFLKRRMTRNFYRVGREYPYKNIKPRVIAEQYMDGIDKKGLIDYKFFCFHGEVKFLYVSEGLEDHSTAHISFVSLDWKKEPFKRKDFSDFDELPPKPKKFDEMLEIAKVLSKGMPFVRVDLYEVEEKVLFSELTFFPCSGAIPFEPYEYDKIIGEMLELH